MGMRIVARGVTTYSAHEMTRYLLYDTRWYFNTVFNRTSVTKCMTGKIFFIQKSHEQCIIWTEQWKIPENSNVCWYDWMQPIYIYLTSLTIHCLACSCNFIDSFVLCTLLFVDPGGTPEGACVLSLTKTTLSVDCGNVWSCECMYALCLLSNWIALEFITEHVLNWI